MGTLTGVIAVWLGALMGAAALQAGALALVTVRLVARYERLGVESLAARSATELAAMLLQRDDRARDALTDAWATSTLPDTGAFGRVWPPGASLVIVDLERQPPHLLRGGLAQEGGVPRARRMNILTAPPDTWERLGFSPESARQLVSTARTASDVRDLSATPGLSTRERAILELLLQAHALTMRSEMFLVRYCHPRVPLGARRWRATAGEGPQQACYEAILRREPARGGITMGPIRRVVGAP